MESTLNTTTKEVTALAEGIQREDQVIEIPRRIYRDTGFTTGEFTATVEGGGVVVLIETIDGIVTVSVPLAHLERACRMLHHIAQDITPSEEER